MKHIIILGDGMADWPVKSLGDKTLLQYAKTPYMDKLARMGRNGRLITVAEGFHPGSEVANMSVLGYNLPKVYEGRGPLEAASIGVDLQPGEMAMRCNLICVEGEILKNHSSGQIRLQRIAISPGFKSTPILAASSGPRPSYTFGRLYPNTDILATSLPGWKPSATVIKRPLRPMRANLSI